MSLSSYGEPHAVNAEQTRHLAQLNVAPHPAVTPVAAKHQGHAAFPVGSSHANIRPHIQLPGYSMTTSFTCFPDYTPPLPSFAGSGISSLQLDASPRRVYRMHSPSTYGCVSGPPSDGWSHSKCCCPSLQSALAFRKTGSSVQHVLAPRVEWKSATPPVHLNFNTSPEICTSSLLPCGTFKQQQYSHCTITEVSAVDENAVRVKLTIFDKVYTGLLLHQTDGNQLPAKKISIPAVETGRADYNGDKQCDIDVEGDGTPADDTVRTRIASRKEPLSDGACCNGSSEVVEPFLPQGLPLDQMHFVMVKDKRKQFRPQHTPTRIAPTSNPLKLEDLSKQRLAVKRKLQFHHANFEKLQKVVRPAERGALATEANDTCSSEV